MKINPRQKSGDAVTRASVAPVQLNCLICHKGINTHKSLLTEGDLGRGSYYIIGILADLGQLSRDTSFLGFFLEAREDPQKKYFCRRQQDHKSGCGEKLRETKIN